MSEFLSKDILDEGFVKSFTPFHWFQMLLGSCRVDARHRFVTSPTIWQKVYTLLLILLISSSYVLFALYYPWDLRQYAGLYRIFLAMMFVQILVCVCNLFHVRFLNNEENVNFFIRLHEIDKRMRIDSKPFVHEIFYKINATTVAVWTVIPTLMFLAVVFVDWQDGLSYFWIFYCQMCGVIEWMYFSNAIIYFYMRLRYINFIMINHLGIEDNSYVEMYKFIKYFHKTTLKTLAADSADFTRDDTAEYLRHVFDALLQFTSLFRFQMFIFCAKFVVMSIMSVEFCLLFLQQNVALGVDRYIGPVVWISDFLILIFICVRWDDFYRELCETKHLATKILATYTEGPLRKKATSMIKAIEENPPHFSVYEMWNMDASTLLSVFDILTTLTITLMQFALL